MTAITFADVHAYQATCLAQHLLGIPYQNFRLSKPKFQISASPNVQMVALVVDGETLVGWRVISRSLHRRINVMFGPVVNTEIHPAFSGARTHSNNIAVMTAMIEALSSLGHHGPVVRDEQSCIYFDSLHAVGVCLGTIQARTHVQLALACQRSMIFAQRKLRFTMQHVYGHNGNFGDKCVDHVVALGT